MLLLWEWILVTVLTGAKHPYFWTNELADNNSTTVKDMLSNDSYSLGPHFKNFLEKSEEDFIS